MIKYTDAELAAMTASEFARIINDRERDQIVVFPLAESQSHWDAYDIRSGLDLARYLDACTIADREYDVVDTMGDVGDLHDLLEDVDNIPDGWYI